MFFSTVISLTVKKLDSIPYSKVSEPSSDLDVTFLNMKSKYSLSPPLCYLSTDFPALYTFLLDNMVRTPPEHIYYRHLAYNSELLKILHIHNCLSLLRAHFQSIRLVLKLPKRSTQRPKSLFHSSSAFANPSTFLYSHASLTFKKTLIDSIRLKGE